MSTRCTVSVFESAAEAKITPPNRIANGEVCHLYRHSDGYPQGEYGVPETLKAALPYAWPLPRFEADDFAAAIIAAWKKPAVKDDGWSIGGGHIRLIHYGVTPDQFAGDSEWHYNVYFESGAVRCQVWEATHPNGWDGERVWQAKGKPRVIATAKTPRFPASEE